MIPISIEVAARNHRVVMIDSPLMGTPRKQPNEDDYKERLVRIELGLERLSKVPEQLTSIQTDLAKMEKDVSWHRLIGGFVIAGVLCASGAGLTKLWDQSSRLSILEEDKKLTKLGVASTLGPPEIKQIRDVIQNAKSIGAPLSIPTLTAVGTKLLNVSKGESHSATSQQAWGAAMELVDYRSGLNELFNPVPDGTQRKIYPFVFDFTSVRENGWKLGRDPKIARTYGDDVPIADAARFEHLGNESNRSRTFGPRLLVVDAKAYGLKIDGYWIKNTVIRNTEIVYQGGPLRLDNVLFINCTFRMENLERTRRLGEQMLAVGSSVSFTTAD